MSEQPDNQAKSIHTDRGSIIKGNVETGGGDFVGRDKIIVNTPVRRTRAEERKLQNRQAMLKLVHDIWVKGVLERSLYNQLLIDLDMEQRPKAVERPWGMVLEIPEQASRLLPSGTKIIDVFTNLNQSLLILGEPGSGKSTMLYELARDLLAQAEQNPVLPMPVLFNLSSWSEKRQPLRQWLVDELREKYQIPKALAQTWVENDELLLLLDGLDEVKPEYREDCIKAINELQQRRKETIPSLALCSRTAEYTALTSKLKLNGAIVLCPLTPQQIAAFLLCAGDKLIVIADLLQCDAELQTLAQSPLTFSLLCLTYQNKALVDITLTDSTGTRLQRLFDEYIMRMFQHRGKMTVDLYPRTRTLRWLTWLAGRMLQYSQTEFLIERLQPEWMQPIERKKILVSFTMFMWGPLYGLICGLIGGLIFGLIFYVCGLILGVSRLPDGFIFVVIFDLWFGVYFGFIFSLISTLLDGVKEIRPREPLRNLQGELKSRLYSGLFWLIILLLEGWLLFGDRYGWWTAGLLGGLTGGLIGGFRPLRLVTQVYKPWKQLKVNLIMGFVVGLIVYVIVGLIDAHFPSLYAVLTGGLIFGSIPGLIFGLLFEPYTDANVLDTAVTQTPNQAIKSSAKTSLTVGVVAGLGSWLGAWLISWLTSTSIGGSITYSVAQVIDVSTGRGFYNLSRELLNPKVKMLIFGIMGSPIAELSFGLLCGLISGVVCGGDVVAKHCIVRFALYFKNSIPWNYARFLDYCADRIFLRKVGGGYVFVHRLLMEHFASLTEEDIKRLAGSVKE